MLLPSASLAPEWLENVVVLQNSKHHSGWGGSFGDNILLWANMLYSASAPQNWSQGQCKQQRQLTGATEHWLSSAGAGPCRGCARGGQETGQRQYTATGLYSLGWAVPIQAACGHPHKAGWSFPLGKYSLAVC